MGILDEAIREHLELKRQHGAEESELKGLESEAFGPADRPDATDAPTEVISPGSSLTVPAGEGDQLDKVFEASRQAEAEAATTEQKATETGEQPQPEASAPTEASASAPAVEPATPTEPAEPNATAKAIAETEVEAEEPATEAPATPVPEPVVEAPPEPEEYDDQEGDAGDLLQRERLSLTDHPTEHYDVDAAIAEEDEIDILSESSLSDELDRALDGPLEETPAAAAPAAPAEPATPSESELPEEPVSDEFEDVFDDEPAAAEPAAPTEPDTGEEEVEGEDEEPEAEGAADFFDQEDPLEATPDFLEETPEHDRLWFEQKPPKDFEFGD
jgi:hypothetical protein